MYRIEYFISVVEVVVNTSKKRHILGGVLISTSLFFGGLAVTIMTIKSEKTIDHELN